MSDIRNGGPAFPGIEHARDPRDVGFYAYGGMTLRDAMALSVRLPDDYSARWAEVLIGEQQPNAVEPVGVHIEWWMRVEAAYRYRMADAMLKAREQASQPAEVGAIPNFEAVRDKRMSELSPAEQRDARELWIREQLGWFDEYHAGHIKFLLEKLDEERAQLTEGAAIRTKAELYDEVWQKARDMGYSNVTMALEALTGQEGSQQ